MVFVTFRNIVYTNLTHFQKWYLELHSLEQKLFILITTYAIVSILSSIELLVLQINSAMSISLFFYLFVLSLTAGSCITFASRSLLYYIFFIMVHSCSIMLYFVLMQFVDNVCEHIVCIKHIRLIRQTALVLFIFSIIFGFGFTYLGYAIWKTGVWRLYSFHYKKLDV